MSLVQFICSFKNILHILLSFLLWCRDQLPVTNFKKIKSLGKMKNSFVARQTFGAHNHEDQAYSQSQKNVTMTKKTSYVCVHSQHPGMTRSPTGDSYKFFQVLKISGRYRDWYLIPPYTKIRAEKIMRNPSKTKMFKNC